MLFDKDGIFCLDELVAERPTFKKIMEDHLVTDGEVAGQADLVLSILRRMEKSFSPEQLAEVEELLAEFGVLYAIHQYKEIQSLRH